MDDILQVVRDFRSDTQIFRDLGNKIDAQKAIEHHVVNAENFLLAQAAKTQETDDVPEPNRKKYRTKTQETGLNLHHQLECLTGIGLNGWKIDKRWVGNRAIDPYLWPRLDIASDRGSDEVCLRNYLCYGGVTGDQKFNIQWHWDDNHDNKNTVKQGLKDAGLWPHQLLVTVAAKASKGPWNSGLRRQQWKAAVGDHLRNHTHKNSPVFGWMMEAILQEKQMTHRLAEKSIEQDLWDSLKSDNAYCFFRATMSLERFMDVVYHQRDEDSLFAFRINVCSANPSLAPF